MIQPTPTQHLPLAHHPWVQTGTGKAVDLIAPTAASIDLFCDVAEGLSRVARFGGQVRSGPYSVAQHCVLGADAIYTETAKKDWALGFLLHDAHEAYLGDQTTPVSKALALYVALAGDHEPQFQDIDLTQRREILARAYLRGLHHFRQILDRAIYTAAGLKFPLDAEANEAVARMDLRMLATERRHLLGPSPMPWPAAVEKATPVRLKGPLRIWPWPEAADQYRSRLKLYLPETFGSPHRGGQILATRPKKRRLKPRSKYQKQET